MEWEFMLPVKLVFGNGKRKEIEKYIDILGGKNGVLVCGKSFTKNGVADEFAKMMGKDVTDFQDDIRRYRLPNTNKIHVVLGMNSEYMTAENGMKYYQALCLIKGLSQEDIDTKNERWLQYVLLLDMAKDWGKKDEIFLAEQKEMLKERGVETE